MKTKVEELNEVTLKNELVLAHTLYITSILGRLSNIQNSLSEINQLNNKLTLLENAGLKDTENYRIIKSQINDLYSINEKIKTYKILKEVVTQLPDSIMIPWEPFMNILAKYHLEAAPLNMYKGIIPTENIMEISKAKKVFDKMGDLDIFIRLRHINKANLVVKDGCDMNKITDAMRFPFVHSTSEGSFTKFSDGVHRIGSEVLDKRSRIDVGSPSDEWIIAAPEYEIGRQCEVNITTSSYQDKLEELERIRLKDPLILKPYVNGVIIVSKWGEEANIQELNNWKL